MRVEGSFLYAEKPVVKPCNLSLRPPATIPIFTFGQKFYHNGIIDLQKGDCEYDFCREAEKVEERERMVTGGTG